MSGRKYVEPAIGNPGTRARRGSEEEIAGENITHVQLVRTVSTFCVLFFMGIAPAPAPQKKCRNITHGVVLKVPYHFRCDPPQFPPRLPAWRGAKSCAGPIPGAHLSKECEWPHPRMVSAQPRSPEAPLLLKIGTGRRLGPVFGKPGDLATRSSIGPEFGRRR